MDCLVVVDLTLTDHKVLKRYQGEEGLHKFMDYPSRSNLEPRGCFL
jgi:hypothetical protein